MSPPRGNWLLYGIAWSALLYLTLPLLVAAPLSVTDSRVLELPRHGISFRHWARLFADYDWLSSIGQSFLIASLSTLIATTAGTLCAIGCWRMASRFSDALRLIMLIPIVVPSIVYAIGLYRFYAELKLLGSYAGVIGAHAATGLPYVVITVSAALANIDPKLEQASRNLGASIGQTITRVIVPNVMPGILSGGVFAFVHSWDELVVVLFIASREISTIPRMIWNSINESLDPRIAAVAVALILVSVIMLAIEQYRSRSRERGAQRQP